MENNINKQKVAHVISLMNLFIKRALIFIVPCIPENVRFSDFTKYNAPNGSVNFGVKLVRSTAPGTETAQQLSVLTVFAEHMGSVPCAHILKLTTTCNSGSR